MDTEAVRAGGVIMTVNVTNLGFTVGGLVYFGTRLCNMVNHSNCALAFSAVTRPEITAAGLNAAAAHPLYSRAHGLAWRIIRTGIADLPTDERLWISPTWEIYERWCFVKLAAKLRTARPELIWERRDTHQSRAIAAWIGRIEGVALTLLLQPTFVAWDQSRGTDCRSLSGELVPDMVLIQEGANPRFFVVDAKYRVERRAVLDAMRSAHLSRRCPLSRRASRSLSAAPAKFGRRSVARDERIPSRPRRRRRDIRSRRKGFRLATGLHLQSHVRIQINSEVKYRDGLRNRAVGIEWLPEHPRRCRDTLARYIELNFG